jgi:uncharacterized protein
MLSEEIILKIKKLCQKYQEIKLMYVFGSVAREDEGVLSDYDFAVYLDENDDKKRFDIKINLMGELPLVLKSDKIDVVVINDTENIYLKRDVIAEGKLIYEKEPFKMIVEQKILNDYFDFREFLDKFQKTK